jgi:hypothetical protein
MVWRWPSRLSALALRLGNLPRILWNFPGIVRMSVQLAEAQDEVAKRDYLAAERRLLRVYRSAPPGLNGGTLVNLLMALVCLRLGRPQAAADLIPTAVGHIRSLRALANEAERAYLSYAARLIYEEATRQLGSPKSLDVGVEYDDLDVSKVSARFRAAYPVHRPDGDAAPRLH